MSQDTTAVDAETTASTPAAEEHAASETTEARRRSVEKTYKLYIGGKFPRTESGRSEPFGELQGRSYANICRASRKDFREAVVAARGAQTGWAARAAYNRAQILYRIAEMLEGRGAQFEQELRIEGLDARAAHQEVAAAVDRLVYFAGWADKYQQVFSSVNPVASSHFNFSIYEPTGVVAVVAPNESRLLGLVSVLAPILVGGNTAVVLAGQKAPLCSMTFAEVLHTSDTPGGVVNVLTGHRDELLSHMASHRDVNALVYCGPEDEHLALAERESVDNLKRFRHYGVSDWTDASFENPYSILDTQEVKTTWHPIGV